MKRLWVAAALAPLSFAATAHAQTVTNTGSITTPVTTTSANPNYLNNGSIVLPTGGNVALTMAVQGNVTNAGTIGFTADSSDAVGIFAGGNLGVGNSSVIFNSGVINLIESTSGDNTNEGITNGPFANGANRTGIEINGPGVFNGGITNTGTITIIGENSAGIAILSEMSGDLEELGTINVTGGSPSNLGNTAINVNVGNVTYGIHATGRIDGNVGITGVISATGQNATGVALGEVDGAGGVVIAGGITATGYRSTAPTTDPNVLALLTPDQLSQGGPALDIGGSVLGGVSVNPLIAATANTTGSTLGALLVDGSAPAMLIGGGSAITIGNNVNTGASVSIGGTVTGVGAYADFGATGIQIGGANNLGNVTSYGTAPGDQFANVTLTNGLSVSGEVQAAAISKNNGDGSGSNDATGILVGSGATILPNGSVAAINNTGVIFATVTSDSLAQNANVTNPGEIDVTGTKSVPVTASAITIQAGGNVTSLNNTNTISATITGITTGINFLAQGGTQGQAIAINDQSGSLANVTNSGLINASVTPIIEGATVDGAHTTTVAMYLANTAGDVTVTQVANANTSITPTINGGVIFGNVAWAGNASLGTITGSENLDLEAGQLIGNVAYLGAGANSLTINNGATLTGALTQSAAGSLNIDVANGTLFMTAPVTNTLGDYIAGSVSQAGPAAVSIKANSLNIGSSGEIVFTIDPTSANVATTPQFIVAGAATLADGAKIGATFTSKLTGNATQYDLINAGVVTAPSITGSIVGQLPYLYAGSITTTSTDLYLTVSRKTAQELGLNPAQSAALSAIYNQMSTDQPIEAAVLAQTSRGGFLHIYNQFLPDYAGGPFEGLATAQRAIADAEAEAPIKLQSNQTRGWVQEIGYVNSRDDNSKSNGYEGQGFGLIGGVEHATGDSAVGVTAAFISDGVGNDTEASDGQISTVAIEGGAYWRAGGEGLQAHASINGGYVAMGSHRLFFDPGAGSVALVRDAESQWNGGIISGSFGVGYQITSGRLSLRPELSADYIALFESAHSEKGGGPAFDLAINSRTSSEASATADVVMGYTFGQSFKWTPQLTLGYRQILTGGPASTTARFISGSPAFTLTPDWSDRGGVLARLGVRAAGPFADVTADAGGEYRDGYQTYDMRARARFLF